MADALASGASGRKAIGVRVPASAPFDSALRASLMAWKRVSGARPSLRSAFGHESPLPHHSTRRVAPRSWRGSASHAWTASGKKLCKRTLQPQEMQKHRTCVPCSREKSKTAGQPSRMTAQNLKTRDKSSLQPRKIQKCALRTPCNRQESENDWPAHRATARTSKKC